MKLTCSIGRPCIIATGLALCVLPAALHGAPPHTTYLWHMHQPIYWPDRSVWDPIRYETAYETITLGHSQTDVFEVFDKDDRVGDYQWYPRDAIASVLDLPDAGAQVSFAASLIENLTSLGDAGWNGGRYAWDWYRWYREAAGWTTSGGRSRMQPLLVAAHHPIAPLMDENAFRKELQVAKAAYVSAWDSEPASYGYFPAEMCFSERLIPVLVEENVDWAIVPDVHISRACADYPWDPIEDLCDPPNRSDQINPAQGYYHGIYISRGVTVKIPPPFGHQPHRAQWIDPDTGVPSSLVVVPAANAHGWDEGQSTYGTGQIDAVAGYNDPAHPMIFLFAHDGDNHWAGGYSYYYENVTNFCHAAASAGYEPTTVFEFLADHPVPVDDIVHVEDGGWVNADGDFGSPQYINWNWPLHDSGGGFDIPNGWATDERNWAVLTAAQNHVETAEAIGGAPDPSRIYDPTLGATSVERAWHFLLTGYESGYMYYGNAIDMEVKATLACNEAVLHADSVIAGGGDTVAPTIWLPQRLPWNPGGKGGGALWGYPGGDGADMATDFWVWTFAHDVSGIARVEFKYRLDADGANPIETVENETYAGGPGVGEWQTLDMTYRDFPDGNYLNDPSLDFFELPTYIADEYYIHVTGLSDVLADYYVEAEDTQGNVKRSPIQHVWIDDAPAHVIDGTLDQNATLLTSGDGFDLYVDWDGEELYVATQGVGSTTEIDHFIFIGVDLTTPVSAPWAKAGTVADRTLYLANENDNNWSGWFDAGETVLSQGVANASGSYLEGSVDLALYLGSELPETIWLCVGGYQTPDGGALVAQAPTGNGDGDVDAAEYVAFPLSVDTVDPSHPHTPQLALSCAPNPSTSSATIFVGAPSNAPVSLSVYDPSGRLIEKLIEAPVGPHGQTIRWETEHLPSGVYFLELRSGSRLATRRVTVIR